MRLLPCPAARGLRNPITGFVNIEKVTGYLARHVKRLGPKPAPNKYDPVDWVWHIGESGDCSVYAIVGDNVRDLVDLFADLPGARASFATEYVNRDLLDWDPRGGTRIRLSLVPERTAKPLDLSTSAVEKRSAAIGDFVEADHEVHLNDSPVVIHQICEAEWRELLRRVADGVGQRARRQLACEVTFLTHNAGLHEVNLGWDLRGEDPLWRPDLQEAKTSPSGQENVRYKVRRRRVWTDRLVAMIDEELPGCLVRTPSEEHD